MGHRVYESFVLFLLKLCVKFEWSTIKDKYFSFFRNCEIKNLVSRPDHAHFVAVRRRDAPIV